MNRFTSQFVRKSFFQSSIQSTFLPSITNSFQNVSPTLFSSCCESNSRILQTQMRSIVQLKTMLQVQDNSGAIEVECVTVPKTNRGHARVGSLIVVVVKKARPNRKVKKKQVCRAIVTQTRDFKHRNNGISFASGENRCVIVDNKMAPVGTRIFGSLPAELRGQRFAKIVSMANAVF